MTALLEHGRLDKVDIAKLVRDLLGQLSLSDGEAKETPTSSLRFPRGGGTSGRGHLAIPKPVQSPPSEKVKEEVGASPPLLRRASVPQL